MASLHVAPVFAANDKPNKAWADAEALRDVALGVPFADALSNLAHVVFCKLRHPITLAESMATFIHLVCCVIGIRAKKQVGRVDARRLVATMADAEAGRYLTTEQQERHAVRAVESPLQGESTITARESPSSPYPAVISDGDLRHEPLWRRYAGKLGISHVSLPQGSLVRPGCDVYGIVPGRIYSISGG